MKKALFVVLLVVGIAAGWVGCQDYDTEALHFVNSSSHTVTVTSLSIEWTGFTLAPGDERKLSGIRDVDYDYEPDEKVKTGSASTTRYIVFVNATPTEAVATVKVDKSLEFINNSTYIVTITSLSTEWTGFTLKPNESKKLKNIDNIDYSYEPDENVKLGYASTDRHLVFVNTGTNN